MRRYEGLNPLSWYRGPNNSLSAPLVRSVLVDPVKAYTRARNIMTEEGQRAYDLSPKPGGHVDTIYDAERHARASYRSAQEFGVIPTMIAGWGNEVGPMAKAIAGLDRARINEAGRAAAMDIHNNNVGLREASAGRQIPTRDTKGLRTLR